LTILRRKLIQDITTRTTTLSASDVQGWMGVEMLRASWTRHTFAPHLHDFYAISLNDRGRGAFDCRRSVHDAAPGTCNLIAPGEVHTGRATSEDGWTYRNLHVDVSTMAKLLRGVEWRRDTHVTFTSSLVVDRELAARLRRLFAIMTTASSLLQRESVWLSVDRTCDSSP